MEMNLCQLWEIVEDRGTWSAIVHRVAKSQKHLSNWTTATKKIGSQCAALWKGHLLFSIIPSRSMEFTTHSSCLFPFFLQSNIPLNRCTTVFHSPSVLFSCSSYNNLAQTWRLNSAEIYSLIVWEAGWTKSVSLERNQGVSEAAHPLCTSAGILSFCLFQFLLASGIADLWLHHFNFCPYLSSMCQICLCLFIRLHVDTTSTHLDNPG